MIILSVLALTFALMFLITKHQRGISVGMYRSYYMLGGLAALGIAYVPNHWLQAVLALMLVNLLRDEVTGIHLSRALPLFLMVLGGVLVYEHSDLSAVFPLLAVIVGGGVLLTGFCLHFLYHEWGRRSHIKLYAGQENVNNTQSISVVCTCAAIGLSLGQSSWWLVALPVVAFPILWTTDSDWRYERSVTMGPVILAGVGLCLLPLWIGWWAAMLLPLVIAGLIAATVQAFRRDLWWDSGRIRCWYTMLLIGWWREGWTVRLLGRGWQSWVMFNDFLIDVARKTNRGHIVNVKNIMSTAHNEFVQFLFEHGAIGFILLVGYVLTALWQLAHGEAEAQAVYVTALGMCGVACTLHPWTWTHGTITEVNSKGDPQQGGGHTAMWTIGSPALNWLAFLVAILTEVAR